MEPIFVRFAARADLAADSPLTAVVNAVRQIPYGRPTPRTPEGVLAQWRGTCSTKHALLAALISKRWPQTRPRIIHRVYRVDRESALRRHGPSAAAAVPDSGLMDIHRYLLITLDGRDVVIDVTFPDGPGWDGHESMPVACGDGEDIPAGADPDRDKAELEAAHCDPRLREPFIAALATAGLS